MKHTALSALALCAALCTVSTVNAGAQSNTPAPHETRVFRLMYQPTQDEQNSYMTALRNMLDSSMRIFLVQATSTVVISGTPEQVKQAGELIAQLDLKQPLYRITYTFTETEGGKRIGLQRYAMTLANGHRGVSKQGSRIPVLVSGGPNTDHHEDRTYLDVGINISSEVETYGDAQVLLNAKVEESSLAEEKSGIGPEDPIIRQTMLEGRSVLTLGKPQAVGSMDIVGSTRHVDVEGLVELVR